MSERTRTDARKVESRGSSLQPSPWPRAARPAPRRLTRRLPFARKINLILVLPSPSIDTDTLFALVSHVSTTAGHRSCRSMLECWTRLRYRLNRRGRRSSITPEPWGDVSVHGRIRALPINALNTPSYTTRQCRWLMVSTSHHEC